MTHSESELDFSFAINSVSDLDSASESGSNSASIFVFFLFHICISLNKPVDGYFPHSHDRVNSYASNASIMHIFFWRIITPKVCSRCQILLL